MNEGSVLGLKEDLTLISREGLEIPVVFSNAPNGKGTDNVKGGVIVINYIKYRTELDEKIKDTMKKFITII